MNNDKMAIFFKYNIFCFFSKFKNTAKRGLRILLNK